MQRKMCGIGMRQQDERESDMTVELICVGTELLLGSIVNTNAAYLAEKCADLGLSCYFQTVVGDNEERLSLTLSQAVKRSDIVILCGGLGPTEDDLTKETAARVCGVELELSQSVKESIRAYFEKRGMDAAENNWKQAMIPRGAQIMVNHNGTAPGIIMETGGCLLILLPGPPNELIPMFEESAAPYLRKLTPEVIFSRTVKIGGGCESKVEMLVKDMIDRQSNPTIATYAKTGEVHIRVTAKASGLREGKKLVKPVVKELKKRFGDAVYSSGEDCTLEDAVVNLLHAKKLTAACAESCTGGMLSARLVSVPGVSEVYRAGFVTYSNKAKKKLLNVKSETLKKHGAVSRKTAREMALGAAAVSGADVTAAITGIAGPGGGTEKKPVGLVYIACSVRGKVTVKKFFFNGNRQKIREAACTSALLLMRNCILHFG